MENELNKEQLALMAIIASGMDCHPTSGDEIEDISELVMKAEKLLPENLVEQLLAGKCILLREKKTDAKKQRGSQLAMAGEAFGELLRAKEIDKVTEEEMNAKHEEILERIRRKRMENGE